MSILERIQELDTSKKRMLLIACVATAMIIILSLWLLVTPPIAPIDTKEAGKRISGAKEDFNETLEKFKSATKEVKSAIHDLSETIKDAVSTSQSVANEPAETSTPASSTSNSKGEL